MMRGKLSIWKSIFYDLSIERPVALLYVTESSGSSPGRRGFMMSVNANGDLNGSIGGGIMEHKFVELAKARLRNEYSGATWWTQFHDKVAPANQSGMICSGAQTICLSVLTPQDREPLQQIITALESHTGGTIIMSSSGIGYSPVVEPGHGQFSASSPQDWRYSEILSNEEHLYLIGGGHCALALSPLMQSLGFYIHLFDDRPDLGTFVSNNAVDQKTLLDNYSEVANHVAEGENSYVVIMTQGYRTDYLALHSLAGLTCRYVGVLGSRNKINHLLAQLGEEGVDQQWLNRLYAPVGLPIKSETPNEIAISIAAQIIMVKNGLG